MNFEYIFIEYIHATILYIQYTLPKGNFPKRSNLY